LAFAISQLSLGQVSIELKPEGDDATISLSQSSSSQIQLSLSNFSGTIILSNIQATTDDGKATNDINISPTQKNRTFPEDIASEQKSIQRSLQSNNECTSSSEPVNSGAPDASITSGTNYQEAVNEAQLFLEEPHRDSTRTHLHHILECPDVTIEQFQNVLLNDVEACSRCDENGRLPLHVLSENFELIDSVRGLGIAREIALQLMAVHPDCLTTEDKAGRIPFQSLILNWITMAYFQEENSRLNPLSMIENIKARLGNISTTSFNRVEKLNRSISKFTLGIENLPADYVRSSPLLSEESKDKFPLVIVTEATTWAFDMLSKGLELLGSFGPRTNEYQHKRLAQSNLATHVASIPFLIKTILLIEDEETRICFLRQPIVRRALLTRESVGKWTLQMLRTSGIPAQRAVDYFELLSSLRFVDYVGNFRTPLHDDIESYNETRAAMVAAFNSLGGNMVPSIFVLPEKEIERAASTAVIWDMMNFGLARPFVIGMAVIDFVLHLTLMISFRSAAAPSNFNTATPTYVVNAIAIFFLTRKIGEGIALLRISKQVLMSYTLDHWNIFDILSITLTVVASTATQKETARAPTAFDAIVLALLWLKVLAFLQAINMEMSTFISSTIKIIFDIRFFSIVLTVVIMMFGDLMHIAFTNSNDGALCDNVVDSAVGDFCATGIGQSYLRMYAVLLGDFELASYQQSPATTWLFFLFTVFGIIILLNVLIAVVSGSYELSTSQARLLFGRARVGFLAKSIALETFLHPVKNPLENTTKYNLIVVFILFLVRWLLILIMAGTAFFSEVYLLRVAFTVDTSIAVTVFNVIMALVLAGGLFILLEFIFSRFYEKIQRDSILGSLIGCVEYLQHALIKIVHMRLFGDVNKVDESCEDICKQLEKMEKKIAALIQASEHKVLHAIKKNQVNEGSA